MSSFPRTLCIGCMCSDLRGKDHKMWTSLNSIFPFFSFSFHNFKIQTRGLILNPQPNGCIYWQFSPGLCGCVCWAKKVKKKSAYVSEPNMTFGPGLRSFSISTELVWRSLLIWTCNAYWPVISFNCSGKPIKDLICQWVIGSMYLKKRIYGSHYFVTTNIFNPFVSDLVH